MNNILQILKSMSVGRLASIAAIFVFLISFFIYLIVQMNNSEYAVLYTDLELEDAKQIVQQLESSNVKYRLTKNGTEVMVPVDMVNRTRVDTAEIAVSSKGSNVGYEVFDNADALGSTNFVQNVNLVRALEGELARTIRSVDNISSARVHLVMPKREMFSREMQKPTASVVIKTKGGTLNSQNVQSIQKLVAAAVPKLELGDVAIVDSSGNLLTDNLGDPNSPQVKNTHNEVLRLEYERKLAHKVQTLLEKTLGVGKAQAQVNVEMDFDEVVTNEEIFDPDSQVVRSQVSSVDEAQNGDASQTVSVAQNIPNGDMVSTNPGQFSQNTSRQETVNYEISKVVRNKVKNSGEIKRLSIAVMVDGVYEPGANGNEVYRSLSASEMDKITTLVQSAVGYDANRGDVVDVENMRFSRKVEGFDETIEVLYMGFTKAEILRVIEGLGVAIVAVLIILLVIRPLINNAFGPVVPGQEKLLGAGGEDNLLLSNFLGEDVDIDDELINLNKVDGRIKVSSLKKLNAIVEKNPDAAVNVIRSWLYNND